MYIQQSEIDFEIFGVVAGETTWIGAWSCVKIETKYEMKKKVIACSYKEVSWTWNLIVQRLYSMLETERRSLLLCMD